MSLIIKNLNRFSKSSSAVGFFVGMSLLLSCGSSDTTAVEKNILWIMNDQQQAWNEGDVEAFMQGYWHSDSLMFIGSKGLNYGWQTTVDNYKESYPDKDAMGELRFDVADVRVLGGAHAYVIGKWTLFRTADTLSGHYTLLWQEINGEWKIVADHSS